MSLTTVIRSVTTYYPQSSRSVFLDLIFNPPKVFSGNWNFQFGTLELRSNCWCSQFFATEAHLGSGELLRAASLREVVRESKARSQRFLLLLFLFVYWRYTSHWSGVSFLVLLALFALCVISAWLFEYWRLRLTVMSLSELRLDQSEIS